MRFFTQMPTALLNALEAKRPLAEEAFSALAGYIEVPPTTCRHWADMYLI